MRRLRGALIAAACVAVTACGGHAATKKDVVARANGICITALRSMREIPPPAGTAGLADYLAKVLPIVEKEAKDTKALPRPVQDHASRRASPRCAPAPRRAWRPGTG
jgi:hypothetical protein